jgi:hypothetical protein
MSKKSRKRNKKILAAIGLGLGAAALSSRKKASDKAALAGTEDGKTAKADRGFTMADVANTAKKDTAKKNIPQDTKVNTGRKKSMAETSTVPEKRPGITVYSDGSIKAPDKGSGNFVDYANKEKYSTRLDTKPPGASGGTTNSGISTARGSSTFNDRVRANNAGLKSGGRAGLRSGGKVKGCGKALRGFGKAMKGKR